MTGENIGNRNNAKNVTDCWVQGHILLFGQIKFCIVIGSERKREKICTVVDFAEKIFAISICRKITILSVGIILFLAILFTIFVAYSRVMLCFILSSFLFIFYSRIGGTRKSTLWKLGGYRWYKILWRYKRVN